MCACGFSLDMPKAKCHAEKIVTNLSSHIAAVSLSSYQLVQMISINLYAIYHARRKLPLYSSSSTDSPMVPVLSSATVAGTINDGDEEKGNRSLTPTSLVPSQLEGKSNGEVVTKTRNKVDVQAYHDLMFDLTSKSCV